MGDSVQNRRFLVKTVFQEIVFFTEFHLVLVTLYLLFYRTHSASLDNDDNSTVFSYFIRFWQPVRSTLAQQASDARAHTRTLTTRTQTLKPSQLSFGPAANRLWVAHVTIQLMFNPRNWRIDANNVRFFFSDYTIFPVRLHMKNDIVRLYFCLVDRFSMMTMCIWQKD